MGQKGSKIIVAENCLRPHHAHKCSDVDLKKLRAFIKTGKLAPCFVPYEGEDWRSRENTIEFKRCRITSPIRITSCKKLEECPICFLAYPALNRTKCCGKEICTECFLQVKLPNGNRGGALCPYCKAEFSVMFRGARTAEERAALHAEEQRVTEATLRAREAENARNEEKSLQLRLARAGQQPRKGDVCETISLEDHASSPVARRSLFTDEKEAVCPTPPRRSGDIDQEALAAVLDSLNLSEYIPSRITAPNTSDIEDAMLQQAIQASLEDSHRSGLAEPSPAASVHPEALACSPCSSQVLDVGSEAIELQNHPAGQRLGRQETAAEAPPVVGYERWEEIDLGQAARHGASKAAILPVLTREPPSPHQAANAEEGASQLNGAVEFEAEGRGCATEANVQLAMSPVLSEEAVSSRPLSPFNPLNTISSCSMEVILTAEIPRLSPLADGTSAPSFLPPVKPPLAAVTSSEGPVTPHPLDPIAESASLTERQSSLQQAGDSQLATSRSLVRQHQPFGGEESSQRSEQAVGPQLAPSTSHSPLPACQQFDVPLVTSLSIARPEQQRERQAAGPTVPFVDEKALYEETPRGAPPPTSLPQHDSLPTASPRVCGVSRGMSGDPSQPVNAFRPGAASRTSSAISLDQRLERLLASGPSTSEDALDVALATSSQLAQDSFGGDMLVTAPASLQRPAGHATAGEDRRQDSHSGASGLRRREAPEDGHMGDCYRGSSLRPALQRQGSSSASSTDDLIGALHSAMHHSPRQLASKSPLPAPPTHLKAFLSGGKRFASPLSGRTLTATSPCRWEERKGPSFADLLSGKSKSFRTARQGEMTEKHRMISPEPLTVAMVRTSSPPVSRSKHKLRDESTRESPSRLSSQASPLRSHGCQTEPSDSPAGGRTQEGSSHTEAAQNSMLYEEPASNGFMSLNKDGGAVFLSQPDGTTQLVLLTPDQQQQVQEAQALKAGGEHHNTYNAPSNDHDLRLQKRIHNADIAMRNLYLQLQDTHSTSSDPSRDTQGGKDSFAERLRKADEDFRSALERRDAATRISVQPSLDRLDEALQRQIAENDAVFHS